jgi:3',5'-cyclic AMP phosphodiesterase CpdA
MTRRQLIHLSDLHIGRRKKESELTRLVIRRISALHPGVPVVITGDLTNSATKTQCRDARAILDDLSKTNPILSVPGNHDYAWKGNFYDPKRWENWVQYLSSPLGWNRPAPAYWTGRSQTSGDVEGLGVWKDGPIVYFGIDSGDPNNKQISARGYISKPLADALKNLLASHRGKTRIALLHHHPFTGGFFTKLHGSKYLMDAVRNNCELLLFGHEHEYGLWWNREGIPLVVSSHKTSKVVFGDCCAITVIEIKNAGTNAVSFNHRIELAQLK